MCRRVWLWALIALAVGSQIGLQPAWAGRRRRCCEQSPVPRPEPTAQAKSAGSVSQAQQKPPATVADKPAELVVPFTLTAAQQKYVDEVLAAWEKKSCRNKSFSASFTCWDYSDTDLQPNNL